MMKEMMIGSHGFGLRLLMAGLLVVLFTLHSVQPAVASTPSSLIISNVRDTSFTVSWLTGAEEVGQVQVVGGGVYDDVRGADYHGITHYVTVKGLTPNTNYSFDLLSGGTRYEGGGAHWAVTTGKTLTPPMPDLILGRVRNPDGSNAADAIVVFTVEQQRQISAPLSMLVTASDKGFFHVNLADLREQADPSHFFEYSPAGDLLTIQAVNPFGSGSIKVGLGDPRLRASDPQQTLTVDLQTPSETPTLVVRQPTPTPIPPAPAPESSGLWLGVGAAAIIGIGILIVAVLFVWRR